MSAPPSNYVRAANFTDFQAAHPSDPPNGTDLDNEFDRIKSTTDQIINRLNLVQRADGKLANLSVSVDTLDSSALALIAGSGTPRGAWAGPGVAYNPKDLAVNGTTTYIAVDSHVSTASFATDLAAGHWLPFAISADTPATVANQINDGPVSAFATAPAGTEPDGTRYIVNRGATGAFAGKDNLIAEKQNGSWVFGSTPKQGQRNRVNDSLGWEWVYRNTWWNRVKPGVTGYQHFGDVPNGTPILNFVIATGQQISAQGTGAATGAVSSGRYDPPSNTYLVVPQHSKHAKMGMRGRWKNTHASGNGLALSMGTYVGGAIISKMAAHADFEYQAAPTLSIWGGPRQLQIGGVNQGYQIEPNLQYQYNSTDANMPVHSAGSDVIVELVVSGNTIRAYADNGHWANSYNDSMVSALLGDDDAGNQGYCYFQAGPNNDANNPYIYEIWWTEFDTPLEVLPDPKQLPNATLTPVIRSKDLDFVSVHEMTRFTMAPNTTYAFEVDAVVKSAGSVAGYAQATRKWLVQIGNFSGTNWSSSTGIYAENQQSINPAVITLTNGLDVTFSGSDAILRGDCGRTGSDSTTYAPNVQYTIRPLGPAVSWT